jgi:hypothetical protein
MVFPALAVARGVASVLVGLAPRSDVGVATTIHGVWVGSTSATCALPGVAVATMILAVWVGCAFATLSRPGVAVTTMIHGV